MATLLMFPAAADAAVRYVAPGGSDSGSCSRPAPCASFDRAYRVATPGDEVEVGQGVYPDQEIRQDPAKSYLADRVLFEPAPGANVIVGHMTVYGTGLEFRDMTLHGWWTLPSADNVVFRNIDAIGGITVSSSSRISMIGGKVGPGLNWSPEIQAYSGNATPPRDILFDGVTFHDWTRNNDFDHVDCLHVMAVDGLVIRNSTFRNCEAFDILFTQYGAAGSPRHVVLENNLFDCCRSGYFSVFLGGQGLAQGGWTLYRDFLIRFNSANKAFGVTDGVTDSSSNVRFDSNVGPGFLNPAMCHYPGVTWTYNVWNGGATCDATERQGASGYADPSALDFHLQEGAVANDAGNPDSYPATDFDGDLRGIGGGRPDAGADERVALVAPPGDPGSGSVPPPPVDSSTPSNPAPPTDPLPPTDPVPPADPDPPANPAPPAGGAAPPGTVPPPVTAPPTVLPPPQPSPPVVSGAAIKLDATSAAIPLACTRRSGSPCRAKLELRPARGGSSLRALADASVKPGRAATVRIRLGKTLRSTLASQKRCRISVLPVGLTRASESRVLPVLPRGAMRRSARRR